MRVSSRVIPLLAAIMAACAGDGGPAAVDTTAKVRFFNATQGLAGSGAFSANGQFANGSALAFAQTSQTCSSINAGTASFGFGTASAGGTGMNGAALMALNNQPIAEGGNYTMVATGSAASPQLYLLDNKSSVPLGANQAAVRFVNLEPGPNVLPNVFYVFTAWPPLDTNALFEAGLLVGAPSPFRATASGNREFSVIIGHLIETLSTVNVNLQAGSVNTIAIVENPSGGHQLIIIPQC